MRTSIAYLLGATSLFSTAFGSDCGPPKSPYEKKKGGCPPFSGDFTIHNYKLYPENVDFDFDSCLLYVG